MAFFDFLNDPNIQQGLGNMGAELAGPGSFASAINPAGLIRNVQNQKAGKELLNMILGTVSGGGQNMTAADLNAMEPGMGTTTYGGESATTPLDPNGMSMEPELKQFMGIPVTPQDQEGATTKTIKQTADGTKITIDSPSARARNAYAGNVPAEAQPRQQPQTGTVSPFWQTLFA